MAGFKGQKPPETFSEKRTERKATDHTIPLNNLLHHKKYTVQNKSTTRAPRHIPYELLHLSLFFLFIRVNIFAF